MAYYSTCAVCGAHLDPGERCTCTEEDKCQKRNKKTTSNTSGKDLGEESEKSRNCCRLEVKRCFLRP